MIPMPGTNVRCLPDGGSCENKLFIINNIRGNGRRIRMGFPPLASPKMGASDAAARIQDGGFVAEKLLNGQYPRRYSIHTTVSNPNLLPMRY
jgi:hypothetical protein